MILKGKIIGEIVIIRAPRRLRCDRLLGDCSDRMEQIVLVKAEKAFGCGGLAVSRTSRVERT